MALVSNEAIHEMVEEQMNKVTLGGEIICRTPGAAVNLRQRMYMFRKRVQKREGRSLWDDLIFKLEKGSCKIKIEKYDLGIVDVIGTEGEPVGDTIVVANKPLEIEDEQT